MAYGFKPSRFQELLHSAEIWSQDRFRPTDNRNIEEFHLRKEVEDPIKKERKIESITWDKKTPNVKTFFFQWNEVVLSVSHIYPKVFKNYKFNRDVRIQATPNRGSSSNAWKDLSVEYMESSLPVPRVTRVPGLNDSFQQLKLYTPRSPNVAFLPPMTRHKKHPVEFCQARTKEGQPCKRRAKPGFTLCSQHHNIAYKNFTGH